MVKSFKTIKIFIVVFALFFLAAAFATKPILAQSEEIKTIYFTPQIEIPFSSISGQTAVGSSDQDGFIVSDLLARYIKAIYDYGIMIGGILAALMLMAGGIIWLTSGGDSGKVSKAKGIIAGSITGVVILMGAYFILNTINPDLVQMKGVKMIVVQNILTYDVQCCHKEQGAITFEVKEEKGYTRYTTGEKAGQIFTSCEADYQATSCPSNGECRTMFTAGQQGATHYCYDPSDVCCTCVTGGNTVGAISHCFDSSILGRKITADECRPGDDKTLCTITQEGKAESGSLFYCERNDKNDINKTNGYCKLKSLK